MAALNPRARIVIGRHCPGTKGIRDRILFGRHQNWLGLSLDLDARGLPAKLDYSPTAKPNVILLVSGFVMAAFQIWIFEGSSFGFFTNLLLLGIIGGCTWMMLFAAFRLSLRRTAVFYPKGVEVSTKHLLGGSQWQLSYSDFTGVLYREVIRGKGTAAAKTFRIIELFHPEKNRRVPLFADYAHKRPIERWEAYGECFGLPLLEDDGEKVSLRKDREAEKTIRERVADRELSFSYEPSAPLPAGIGLAQETSDGEVALTISFTTWAIPKGANHFASTMLLPIVMAPFLGGNSDNWFDKLIITSLIIAIMAFAYMLWIRLKPQRLRLTRQGLSASGGCLSAEMAAVTLTLAEIRRLDIEKSRSANFAHDLVLEDDNNELAFGHGLNREQLIWLGDFLTAAIATA